MQGLGVPNFHKITNLHTIYSWPSVYAVPLYAIPLHPWLYMHGFKQHIWCSTIVFSIEKYLCISGPTQFKPVLFKGQLYMGET